MNAMCKNINDMDIKTLVDALPEIYQPVFGFAEYSTNVSRVCDDRLAKIQDCYSALSTYLNRPLKVLDLGCAQGFISLTLAKAGAEVLGVDFSTENIDLCNKLAEMNSNLKAKFVFGRIEEIIETLDLDSFDMVLGLSVFHHLVHEHGAAKIQDLIARISKKVGVLIFELALKSEPLYWGPSQMDKAEDLVNSCAFVYELAKFPTHLSQIARPLLVASNKYWVLGKHADKFDKNLNRSFSKAIDDPTHRQYFHSKNSIAIKYNFCGVHSDANKRAFERNLEFYNHPPKKFVLAEFIEAIQNEKEGWIAFKPFAGKTLYDSIRHNDDIDEQRVILDILDQLILLEEHGLFYDDLRTWNVLLLKEGGACLIDYESISNENNDVLPPKNSHISFLIFINEVINRSKIYESRLRFSKLNLVSYKEPYRAWILNLLELQEENKLSFSLMKKLLVESLTKKDKLLSNKELSSASSFVSQQLLDANKQFEQMVVEWLEKLDANQEVENLLQSQLSATRAELEGLYASRSWKVTKPLRWFTNKFQKSNSIYEKTN